ncbi:hypothetical protein Hs30E_12990 [Lactococcus hodotermopsidis]|uniref:Peptidase S74 domain-containing protein n=1 Tax=Pseudolactococcus hodotermopsidis TaxID=2709157 RepID=A0A6A0BEJ3_9LACT|nr:hypothetical protein [Lactococcus hodotermopsidis]GFH42748.1 hypothetical protein Hs30E_12990 [Lactococcus hodotermopsidis]
MTSAETTITQQAGLIQLKASQTSVDTLTGKMTTAESKITQMSSDINLRVTKNDIINQINLSSEGVLISANKLTIETTGNMLTNSEFQSNNFFDGWFFQGTQTVNANKGFYDSAGYHQDSTGGRSYSVGIDRRADTTTYWSGIYQDVRARADFPYSASGVFTVNEIGAAGGSGARLELEALDSAGAILGYSRGVYRPANSGYATIKIENFVAPSGTVKMRLKWVVHGATRAYATRFMLNKGVKAAPYDASTGALYVVGNMIVDGAITADKVAANAIVAGKIAANAVTATQISAGAITTVKLAAGAVTATTIGAGAVIADKIGANAVTTAKLAAGAVTSDKITVANLAAINGNLGTLTAGTIDASVVTVKNLNASNISTGTLNAARIAANTITSTHINVANLAAISANLGTITAGTINASTVNITNLNASNISTGTLNAARIAANSITADKISATSLALFSNDTYLKVLSNGVYFSNKAQIIFENWNDSNGELQSTEGLYIGGRGSGTKHVAFTRSNGSTFMLRSETGMAYGANTNIATNALNIYDYTHIWNSMRVHSTGLVLDGYLAMGGGVSEASIQYDKGAGTMNFRVPGERSGSYYWFNQKVISTGSFSTSSQLSLKDVKGDYQSDALAEICKTNIVEYAYKNSPNDKQLSPIIDDVNVTPEYYLPDIVHDNKTVNLYAMSSLSWLAIKQLAQKIGKIEEKLNAYI